MKTIVALLIALSLTACATERHLTAEQDAEMKANCEPHGCAVIPIPAWRQIEQILRSLGFSPA